MMSSSTINAISNRLSLRAPQRESLEILAKLIKELDLSKDADLDAGMKTVASLYPTFKEFERSFPSLCFALATGVGKTRLMGAVLFMNILKLHSIYMQEIVKHHE
jgi:type III restriction enzyme